MDWRYVLAAGLAAGFGCGDSDNSPRFEHKMSDAVADEDGFAGSGGGAVLAGDIGLGVPAPAPDGVLVSEPTPNNEPPAPDPKPVDQPDASIDVVEPQDKAEDCRDTDGDELCDSIDPCPLDVENDQDKDGVCEAQDPCPKDRMDDRDADGICDSEDICPADYADDSDGDGVCDSDDPCPDDPEDDSDDDGVCDSDDRCPGEPEDDINRNGAPDACETCADLDQADSDRNGHADACDQTLWSETLSVTSPEKYLLCGITVYLKDTFRYLNFQLSAAKQTGEVSVSAPDLIGTTWQEGLFTQYDFEPAVRDPNFDRLEAQIGTEVRTTRARPIAPDAHLYRAVASWSIDGNVATVTMELRGW